MDKLATRDTIGSSFRSWLSCQGICLLNRHQTGDTDSVQPVILLPVPRDSQETFLPCEARMLWYAADRTSSQQLRDTTEISPGQELSRTEGNQPRPAAAALPPERYGLVLLVTVSTLIFAVPTFRLPFPLP